MIYKFEKEDGFKTIELFEYKDCLRIFTQEHKQEGVYIDLNKEDLCYYVAKHNEKKAHDLLHQILKERMSWWWD